MKTLLSTTLILLLTGTIFAQQDVHAKYAIKFSPTQLLAGEFHFEYEQAVAKQISVYANLGPTFSELNLQTVFLNDIYDGKLNQITNWGYFGGIGARYYLLGKKSTAIKGLYIGPELKYRVYNSTLEHREPGSVTAMLAGPIPFKYNAKQFSVRLQIGYQFMLRGIYAMDLFLNVGYGNTSIDTYELNYVNWNPVGEPEIGYINIQRNRDEFVGVAGLKIGLGIPKTK